MGFHLTYVAVLASLVSLNHDPLALLLLLVPVALVVAFVLVGRSRPQYRRAIPLLVIAVLVAFTLPLGLVPLQEAAAGWQVTGNSLHLDSPPDTAVVSLKAATWSVVNVAAFEQTLTMPNGFSDATLKTGTFQIGHGGEVVVLLYGPPAQGVLIGTPGHSLMYLMATPALSGLETALRQDSGPPTP